MRDPSILRSAASASQYRGDIRWAFIGSRRQRRWQAAILLREAKLRGFVEHLSTPVDGNADTLPVPLLDGVGRSTQQGPRHAVGGDRMASKARAEILSVECELGWRSTECSAMQNLEPTPAQT